MKTVIVLCACLAFSAMTSSAELRPILQRAAPALDAAQEVQMLTVSYAAGESSPPHRHNAHTFVYVLEGSVRMQVAGSEAVLLEAGDSFYESPEDIHLVSENASTTEPAKFLVFFLKQAGAQSTLPAQ